MTSLDAFVSSIPKNHDILNAFRKEHKTLIRKIDVSFMGDKDGFGVLVDFKTHHDIISAHDAMMIEVMRNAVKADLEEVSNQAKEITKIWHDKQSKRFEDFNQPLGFRLAVERLKSKHEFAIWCPMAVVSAQKIHRSKPSVRSLTYKAHHLSCVKDDITTLINLGCESLDKKWSVNCFSVSDSKGLFPQTRFVLMADCEKDAMNIARICGRADGNIFTPFEVVMHNDPT